MSIFGDIWRGVTGPVRFVGNLAQGKVRKAVGALGDTAKVGSFALGATGVGLPLAAGVGALGGAASKWGRGESNIGKIALGGLGGAAYGAGGTAARGLFAGGLPGGGTAAGVAEGPSMGFAGNVAKQGLASKVGGGLSNIGRFVTKNPELALGAAETGLRGYSSAQEGAAADRAQALAELEAQRREEERQRQFRLEQMQTILGTMGQFRPRY